MIWLILLSILCALTFTYFEIKFSFWKNLNIPYMKPSIPFGNFKDVITMKMSIGQLVQEIYNKTQEKIVGIWIFWIPVLIIKDPSLINTVLVKDFNHFADRAVLSDEKCDSVCSNMLFFLKNPEWKNVRSQITPYFSTAKLKLMFPLLQEAIKDMKDYLLACEGKMLESKELSVKYSTDVIMSTMYGLKGNSFVGEDPLFFSLAKNIFKVGFKNAMRFMVYFFLPDVGKLFKVSFIDPKITKFLRIIVWKTIQNREITKEKRNDIVDRLMELRQSKIDVYGDGKAFDEDRIVAVPMQMFSAGLDTIASILAYALFELGLQRNIQEKLRQEILNTIEAHESLTYEAIKDMVYLDRVVNETLRKYPILPYLDRRASTDYKIPGTNFVIKKGIPIYIPLLGIHYDPKYYPNPEVFDPERFSKENAAKHKDGFLPFGFGPRFCIGNRFGVIAIKMALIEIVGDFRIVECEKTVPIEFDSCSGLLCPKDGLWMKYESIR